MGATINQSSRTRPYLYERYASSMEKKRKPKWERKPCGCVKTELSIGKVLVRCTRHRGKPSKSGRVLCYFDDAGIVQREDER